MSSLRLDRSAGAEHEGYALGEASSTFKKANRLIDFSTWVFFALITILILVSIYHHALHEYVTKESIDIVNTE